MSYPIDDLLEAITDYVLLKREAEQSQITQPPPWETDPLEVARDKVIRQLNDYIDDRIDRKLPTEAYE